MSPWRGYIAFASTENQSDFKPEVTAGLCCCFFCRGACLRAAAPQAVKQLGFIPPRLGAYRSGVLLCLLYLARREPPASLLPTYNTHMRLISGGGMEHSAREQSIWPAGTNQANSGSRLDPVPSHPFSIYKTGLAYNEKHYLLPGHIILTSSRRRSYGARAKE